MEEDYVEYAVDFVAAPTSGSRKRRQGVYQHQQGEEAYLTSLLGMKGMLDDSQVTFQAELTRIQKLLNSRSPLLRATRNYMAEIVGKRKSKICGEISAILERISSFLEAIKDGSLLPMTKGYKALQKNFDNLLRDISQISVLHDLASKCYSKGLITLAERRAAFATGGDLFTQAHDFLDLICSRVKRDGKKYDTFLSILRSEPAYENLVVLAGGI
ncbi:hypothetical protein GBAR_LOCUS12275 [Geodia barretti]|uniref:Uncharacterized protein n=1 Tax=Geodia barretti TaxID=519541 RepID=A0AA35RZA9_GEOBA|nr:hypothetical protein GBAR_LOCUS12275 [Geodia barretti]